MLLGKHDYYYYNEWFIVLNLFSHFLCFKFLALARIAGFPAAVVIVIIMRVIVSICCGYFLRRLLCPDTGGSPQAVLRQPVSWCPSGTAFTGAHYAALISSLTPRGR